MGCQCTKFDRTNEFGIESTSPVYEMLRAQLEDYPVLLYSKLHCENSAKAKNILRKHSVKFEYFELDHMNEETMLLTALQGVTGKRSTPFIFIHGKFYGGIKEFMLGVESGEFFNKIKPKNK